MPYPDPPAFVLPDPWVVDELRLRLPTEDDAPALVDGADDDVLRHTLLPSPFTEDDALDYVDRARTSAADRTAVRVLAVDASTDQLLGSVGLFIAWGDTEAELGYWLTPPARGRGVAHRACHEVLRFGFEVGLGKIWLRAAATNPPSNRLAERLGFRREGLRRLSGIDGATGDLSAPRVDLVEWGLLPHELAPRTPSVPRPPLGSSADAG